MTEIYHIYGPPGCGKTTTLTRQAKRACESRGDRNVVIGSLTKAAAMNIGSKGLSMPKEHIGTLHSLCYHALDRPDLAETNIKLWNEEYPCHTMQAIGYDIDTVGDTDSTSDAGEMLEQIGLYRSKLLDKRLWPKHLQRFYAKWCDWKDENDFMDFTDLIERSITDTYTAPGGPEVLIGDEAQDWSALEMQLFREHWGSKAEIVVLAADPDQSIYRFRGSNPRLFMDYPIPDKNRIILDQSYRVPQKVCDYAQKLIRRIKDREDIKYLPTSHTGSIQRVSNTFKDITGVIRLVQEEVASGRTVMILAACGYMLASKVIPALRSTGIPYANKYKPEDWRWNPLGRRKRATMPVDRVLAFLRPDVATWGDEARNWTEGDYRKWISVLRSGDVLARGTKKHVESDQFVAVRGVQELMALFGGDSPQDHVGDAIECNLQWFKDSLMTSKGKSLEFAIDIARKHTGKALRDTPLVTVGTIHSVKGGEADTVVVFPDVSIASQKSATLSVEEKDNIIRLFYVAVTRTRDKLVLCEPQSRGSFNW